MKSFDAPMNQVTGFEHINSYFDQYHNCNAAKLLPGEFYVSTAEECIVTVLGSCVSACVRDPVFGIGGMNHFMLPSSHGETPRWGHSEIGVATRFGNFAMEHLLNTIIRHGGRKRNFEVKLFGGGLINNGMSDVGATNIRFVHQFLQDEGINVKAEDLGGIHPRKVYYFPRTGRVLVKRLKSLHNDTIVQREIEYSQSFTEKPVTGDIVLFD